MTGYAHPQYAESLKEFGTPRELPRCRGWILERKIPRSPYHDGMGCYPLFTCQDWSQLYFDLEDIDDLVTLALVTDPFGGYDEGYLHQCFKDVVIPFKEHFIVDLSHPISDIVSKHHRYYARKALKNVYVEKCHDPTLFINEWVDLYASLIKRHDLKGIKAFSRAAFAKQLSIPGMVMLRAVVSQGTTVGLHLWYVQGEVAYSHLAAFNPVGYDLMASYSLYWSAIEYFADKVRWLDLGAGAGVSSSDSDGLSQFKRGWSTGTRTAYFCGRIFDHVKYLAIAEAKGINANDYFPAYRKGEFG